MLLAVFSAFDLAESSRYQPWMGVDSIKRGIDTFVANLFIIGYPRSGTTALWKMLKQHPDIETPVQNRRELKELYALQLKRRGRAHSGNCATIDREHLRSLRRIVCRAS